MIYTLLLVVHILVCVSLMISILLQSGKGADLAGAFGGGSTQTAFGSRGPASFLSKLTTVSAVLFMGTCLTLSLIGSQSSSSSILDTTKGASAPATKAPAVQPSKPVPATTPEEIKKMQLEIEEKQKQNPPAGKTPAATAPDSGSNEKKPAPAKDANSTDAAKKP